MRASVAMITFAKVASTFLFDTTAIICQIMLNDIYTYIIKL